ncbi:MAG: hypothetical protein HC804_09915 [Anaerolineae bacterium]|nr:hypothetical protein [Anaerolineae bacterium]
MADDILTNYQHVVTQFSFFTGSKGAFEFKVDGELLYSKKSKDATLPPAKSYNSSKNTLAPK